VIDSYGRPGGVVSDTDLLPKEEQRDGPPPLLAGSRRWRQWDKARSTTADDVMTREGADHPPGRVLVRGGTEAA
jgi:hypothetical protein